VSPRARDTLLLIAGLPGVTAPFVPFMPWIFSRLSLLDTFGLLVNYHDAMALLIPPALLPAFIATWQLRRVLGRPTSPTERLIAGFAACLTLLMSVAGTTVAMVAPVLRNDEALDSSGNGWEIAFYTGVAASLWLLLRNRRRALPPDTTIEVFLLGTYIAATLTWTLFTVREGALIGAWLILWTCLVYLATIVIRLRSDSTWRVRHTVTDSRCFVCNLRRRTWRSCRSQHQSN
jgi:hypothetical protein